MVDIKTIDIATTISQPENFSSGWILFGFGFFLLYMCMVILVVAICFVIFSALRGIVFLIILEKL